MGTKSSLYAQDPGGLERPVPENDFFTDWMPAWSPDAQKIVFASDRTGDFDLYLMDADGANVVKLTDGPSDDLYPSWSPDGQRIAFSSSRDNQYVGFVDQDIYVLELESGDVTRVGPRHIAGAVDSSPDWAPDGSRIVLAAESPELLSYGVNILVMDADGSDMRYLTESMSRDDVPSWAPDGTRIAYASSRESDFDIYVMDADGSNTRRLTDHPGPDFKPSWSSDGRHIAFESRRKGDVDVYMMSAGGGEIVQLTDDPADDFMPVWSPDGEWIAFVSDRDGDSDIFILRIDGPYALKKLN